MAESSGGKRMAGVLGFFDGPAEMLDGMKKIREEGYESYDAFSPFPIHGMDDVQGLKRSTLPWITFTAGVIGLLSAFAFQYWTSTIDWPIIVGGMPFNSWPAFVPIMFELTVLFAGISTVFGMIFLNRLPNITKAAFDPRITTDRFALFIESPQPKHGFFHVEGPKQEPETSQGFKKFSESEASAFLSRIGAKGVKTVYYEGWF